MKSLEFWTVEGFEVSSNYSLKIRANQTYTISKDGNLCTYTYNELGFRGDSINKKGFRIMSIGDSMTEGMGVNDNETWSHQLCKLIPNAVDLNFGFGGRSCDYVSRCLLTYYNLVKPDLVLIMYPPTHRRDVYTKDGRIEPFTPIDEWGYMKETEDGKRIQKLKTELQNDNEDFINWYKNHLLIKYFLESKGCNWLWTDWQGRLKDYSEFNRFHGNYNYFIDIGADGKHPGKNHNFTYSTILYKHIYNNFKNYLPDNIDIIKSTLI